MSAITRIDQGIKSLIFSLFWFFIDPVEKDRLVGQLKDTIERNLDVNNPDKIAAPDNFEIVVNNKIFIKHAHAIKKLESILADKVLQFVADKDYEMNRPRVKVQILSSATISKRKVDIRCWFSDEESEGHAPTATTRYQLKVVDGDAKGKTWDLIPGKTYKIGRHSSADICLPFDKISKNQASLHFVSENKITIADDGSANGTFLNDEEKRIAGSREIKIGGKIRFCKRDPIIVTLQTK